MVSDAEHQALLDQWNAIVAASGSRTHGGAVGRVAAMRRALELIRAYDAFEPLPDDWPTDDLGRPLRPCALIDQALD